MIFELERKSDNSLWSILSKNFEKDELIFAISDDGWFDISQIYSIMNEEISYYREKSGGKLIFSCPSDISNKNFNLCKSTTIDHEKCIKCWELFIENNYIKEV